MNETGSRSSAGMTSPRHASHQAVMDRLRQRFSQYRKRHYDCQKQYAESLPAVQDMERQEALNLHKRALDSRNRMMNMNGKTSKQNDGEGKVEQQQTANGFEKSTNAIYQIREQQILLKKRKHEQNMNSTPNTYVESNDDNLGGEYMSKHQRQDGILHAPSTEGQSPVVSVNQPHQITHAPTQVHQNKFNPISIQESVGTEAYPRGCHRLPLDFKREKVAINSCDESTHSENGPGTVVNGEDYIRQELIHFENVIKRFNEDSAPATSPSVHPSVGDRASLPGIDEKKNRPQSLQLKEIARKSQFPQGQPVVSFGDSQERPKPQLQQHSSQYPVGPTGQQSPGLRHPYTAGKYPEGLSVISNNRQQLSRQYQMALSSQPPVQQQQPQPFYGFQQDGLPKLTHMPSQVQQLYSRKFQSQPVISSSSQVAGLRGPVSSHDVGRYTMPRSQTQFQRQKSMPPLQNQPYSNSDSQYQPQVGSYQGDLSGFSDQTNTYHYQRRNSFPIYHRTNSQPQENFSHGMQHTLGSSQASLLRGVLQTPSQNVVDDRESYLMNSNMRFSSSSSVQTVPLLTRRPPSSNGDLNSAAPRSQHSSMMYRGSIHQQQQSDSVLQQGSEFQTSSVPLREMTERYSSVREGDAQYAGISPLSSLDKAPSFTSLLEQSAINQGNLETTYTGSIPNLDLLGELLG